MVFGGYAMGEEEKEQTIHEEDEHGNILIYPAWSKKNAPKDRQDRWEVRSIWEISFSCLLTQFIRGLLLSMESSSILNGSP